MAEHLDTLIGQVGRHHQVGEYPKLAGYLDRSLLIADAPWHEANSGYTHEFYYHSYFDHGKRVAKASSYCGKIRTIRDDLRERIVDRLLYGDGVGVPGEPVGLSQYYNKTDIAAAANAAHVIDAGGKEDGALFSIWVIEWCDKFKIIYPKGSMTGGLIIEEIPESDKVLRGLDAGWAIEDWRYAVRIANCYAGMDASKLEGHVLRAVMMPLSTGRGSLYGGRYAWEQLKGRFAIRCLPELKETENRVI